ncbi:MAG: glucose-6-phosphate isomerase [Anaerolineales bacterium]|nr:glucose-6-phosphate isomerase [Anaerolineales bacterium]
MTSAKDIPFTFGIDLINTKLEKYDNHIIRTLSAMKGQYLNQTAFEAMVAKEDILLYEVYEIKRPELCGELLQGLSIVHPGTVGDEYFMTKGHFHTVLETGEVYYCLQGEGVMVMETPEGDWSVEELRPGRVLYVPPRWAHRSVNTSAQHEDLVTFFVYPGHAGHDYGTIESQGFRKLVIAEDGQPKIIDNPRWKAPEQR